MGRDARTILVVDDEFLIQVILEDALEEAGHSVLVASTAADAIAILEADVDRLAGVITDIRLGIGATGWDVARRARELSPQLPILYISGDSQVDWLSLGVSGSQMVSKPFLPRKVISLLQGLTCTPPGGAG